jgi:hypothetical protein
MSCTPLTTVKLSTTRMILCHGVACKTSNNLFASLALNTYCYSKKIKITICDLSNFKLTYEYIMGTFHRHILTKSIKFWKLASLPSSEKKWNLLTGSIKVLNIGNELPDCKATSQMISTGTSIRFLLRSRSSLDMGGTHFDRHGTPDIS